MRQDYTHITIVLDKSGSMAHLRADMIGSFNEFVKEQKGKPGDATLTLALFSGIPKVEFDDVHLGFHDKDWYQEPLNFAPLSKVEELTPENYKPAGSTPLLDAVAKAITRTGSRLAALDEKDRPGAVMFVIMTDGEENASRTYDNAQVAAMIKEQTEKYSWAFSFIGANQDSFAKARSMNIPQGNVLNFSADAAGVRNIGKTMSHAASSYRAAAAGGQSLGLSDKLYESVPDMEGVEKLNGKVKIKKGLSK